LPATLVDLSPAVLSGAKNVRHVSVEEGNRAFKVCGDFLMNLDDTSVVRYFGEDPRIDGFGPRLKQLCDGAFAHSLLASLWVPASVALIGDNCFFSCENLATVFFESNSRLSSLGCFAFCMCSSLSSITVPSSLETVPLSCFAECQALLNVTFEFGSNFRSLRIVHFRVVWGFRRLKFLGR
jgi:hypothetical protein